MAQQAKQTVKNNASTTRKTGNTKKKTNNKKKNTKKKGKKQKTLFDIVNQQSFIYMMMLAGGVLLLLLTCVSGGFMTPWNKLRSCYFGLFGLNAFLLPFFFLVRAVLGIVGRDKYYHRTNSVIVFVGALLVGAVIYVNTQASASVSFGDALKNVTSALWIGSSEFVVTKTGLLSALVGGALFALGQNRILADVLLMIFILVDVMALFRLTPQRIFHLLEQPFDDLVYIINNKRESARDRREREADENERRDAATRDRVAKRKENRPAPVDDMTVPASSQRTSKRKSGRQIDVAPDPIPQDSAPVKRQVTATSTKALIEEFENDESKGKNTPDIYAPIPDMFLKPTEDIADIFTVPDNGRKTQATQPQVDVSQPSQPASVFATQAETVSAYAPPVSSATVRTQAAKVSGVPTATVPVASANGTEKKETITPLTDAEKQAASAELAAGLETPAELEKVYELPPVEILSLPQQKNDYNNEEELQANGEKLIAALKSFNVSATVQAIVPGPTVTRYELSPAPGVKINRFVSLADDLALHLAAPAGLRIEAPIPNKAAIGIEVPNKSRRVIAFREILDTNDYRKSKSKLNVGLGKDISGAIICSDLAKLPHLLVAGTTGSGKSVCMNTMICSLLYNATPDEVKLLLIDPKQVEFSVYNGIPHLLVPVVSDPRKAAGALGWAVTEMLNRYKTLNANSVRDIGAYNQLCELDDSLKKMPQIVIFIDELADLMSVAQSEVEDSIQRLAQMARAAGMHLVIATQRPSVDVITGIIKSNIPSRIALSVSSQVDSRTIIDSAGAEKLMGYGDMLYYPVGVPKPMRVQGAFLSDKDIENVVTFIKSQGETKYSDDVEQEIERHAAQEKKKGGSSVGASSGDVVDQAYEELVQKAAELFVNNPEKASTSSLQRYLHLGYAKAGSLVDTLEERGIVGPSEGSRPRKVLITKAQWYEMQARQSECAAAASAATANITENTASSDADDVPFDADNNEDE